MQEIVASQSTLVEQLVILDEPLAMALRRIALCEIDLSPGGKRVPSSLSAETTRCRIL
jgi:hypothetical protein